MDGSATHSGHTHAPARSGSDIVGRVVAVTGSQATVELYACSTDGSHPTVGKYMGMVAGKAVIIGIVTDIGEQAMVAPAGGSSFRKVARLDLVGEIRSGDDGVERFQRGVMEYPNIGDGTLLLSERELRQIYG